MNKTINVNLGGMAYILDENAYETLLHYLENIKKRFSVSEQAEIMQDIESRIAELLNQKLDKSSRMVGTITDVNEIMQKMGHPSDIAGTDETTNTESQEQAPNDFKSGKRLYRYTKDMIVGGICSGLSMYLGINDPIWLRILFLAILFFSGGTIAIIYLIGMAIIPKAKTTMDLMQMKGTPINLSTIEKSFETLRDELNSTNSRESIHRVVDSLIKIGLYLVGAFVILVGMALLLAIVGIIVSFLFDQNIVGFSDITTIYDYFFTDNKSKIFIIIGSILSLGIPALSFIFGGIEIIIKKSILPKNWGILAFMLWIIGILFISRIGFQIYKMMRTEWKIENTIPVQSKTDNPLRLISIQDLETVFTDGEVYYNDKKMPKDSLYLPNIMLDIQKSTSGETYLIQKCISNGENAADAKHLASQIRHNLTFTDSSIFFDPLLKINSKRPVFRNQKVKYTLYLPVGKSIYLDQSIENLIYDIDNIHNLYDDDMLGHRWTMTENGLSCNTCNTSDLKEPKYDAKKEKGKGKITINDEEYEIMINKKKEN